MARGASVAAMVDVELAGPSGVVVLKGYSRIQDIPDAVVREHYRTHGALWLQECNVDALGFLEFIQRFSSNLVTLNSPERRRHFAVPELQSVTGGSEALNFHTEGGSTPNRPQFLSFLCEAKAKGGGQTLLVDGVKLWRALSEGTREFFQERRIRYVMRTPHQWWTHFLGGDAPELVEAALGKEADVTFQIEADGTLVTDWKTPAAFTPRFGTELAFASNLFPYVVPGLTVGMEDGTPVPQDISLELMARARELTTAVEWNNGDVVLLDNTRWLHGRNAVQGLGRRVQMLLGSINFGEQEPLAKRAGRTRRKKNA